MKKTKNTEPRGTKIEGCHFIGVHWDATAVGAIQTIADGLIENAKGLGKLAEVLKASNVTISSLLTVSDGEISDKESD